MMKNYLGCKGLIAVSNYNIKPVHFISMSTEYLEWKNKKFMVYFNVHKKMLRLEFLRLNINYEYNFSVGGIDVSDKLRNQYHFDYCPNNFKL